MRALLAALAATALISAGCGAATGPSAAKSLPTSTLSSSPTDAMTTSTTTPPPVTKVLVFVEENHSLAQMKAGMPYAYGLAKRYGYASNFIATTHPSLPNYIAIASGSTAGITDDKDPASHKLTGQSVFGQAITAGKTAAVYAEGMPSPCAQTKGGFSYVPKHNPWAYFVNERAACNEFDGPSSRMTAAITDGKLPTVGMVVPNLLHDAHDGSLGSADAWFKGWMTKIFAGPDWKSGHLVVILTADEDDRLSGNKVMTVVMSPRLHGKVVTTKLTHYSITRLYEVVAKVPFLGKASTAPSISGAFGLN